VESDASAGFLWCLYFHGQCLLGTSDLFCGRLSLHIRRPSPPSTVQGRAMPW
jgi:hypothetical protein